MKSFQFFTSEGRGGTMLCDDETLEDAVSELRQRFKKVIKVQLGKEVWQASEAELAADAAVELAAENKRKATENTGTCE